MALYHIQQTVEEPGTWYLVQVIGGDFMSRVG